MWEVRYDGGCAVLTGDDEYCYGKVKNVSFCTCWIPMPQEKGVSFFYGIRDLSIFRYMTHLMIRYLSQILYKIVNFI